MRLPHRLPTTSGAVLVLRARRFLSTWPVPFAQSPQSSASQADSTDAQRCAALAAMDFGSLPDAPTRSRARRAWWMSLRRIPRRLPARRTRCWPRARSSSTARCSAMSRRRTSSSCACRCHLNGTRGSTSGRAPVSAVRSTGTVQPVARPRVRVGDRQRRPRWRTRRLRRRVGGEQPESAGGLRLAPQPCDYASRPRRSPRSSTAGRSRVRI